MTKRVQLTVLFLMALVVVVNGCGDADGDTAGSTATPTMQPTNTPSPGPTSEPTPASTASPGVTTTPTASPEPTSEPTPEPTAPTSGAEAGVIYLMFAGYPTQVGPYLVPVARDIDDPGDLESVLAALTDGPTEVEAGQYLSSAIPEGTEVLGVRVSDGIATIDVSRPFESGGGSTSMLSRVAQFVYTATRLEGIEAVEFEMEGEPLTVLGGEGLLLEEPQTRDGYYDLRPSIAIENPTWGETVSTSIEIDGSADIDAQSFRVVLVDSEGVILVDREVPAGSPSRARFELAFEDLARPPASVIVFHIDDDGRQRAVLEYPLSGG